MRSQPAIILARLACLRECLGLIQIGIAADEPKIDRERLTTALQYAQRSAETQMNLSATVPGKLKKFLLDDSS
jgi:hypothetical protein